MPRVLCLKLTGPEPVASWPLSPATSNRPAIAGSGPLDLATGNRPGGAQRVDIARAARPVARGWVPSGIGSKPAAIRQKSAIFAPPPTRLAALARAMFLANIYVKNDMSC